MDRKKILKYIINKEIYFFKVIKSYITYSPDKICPFCNSLETSELMDKFFFVKLFRCNNCSLMFRWPKDRVNNQAYYKYCYDDPKATAFPTDTELEELKANNFKNSIYDISDKISLIKKYIKEGNVLDYGASWGYNLWQFINEGFSGLGYEIAIKRAKFGQENLGIRIIHDSKELDLLGSIFDVIFANHILEHVQDIRSEFNRIYKLLKYGGYLYTFIPDCSNIEEELWKKIYAFGEKHCLAFDKSFFYKNLSSLGFRVIEVKESKLGEYELMVIAKKETDNKYISMT